MSDLTNSLLVKGVDLSVNGLLRSRDELGLSSAEIARHVGINTSSIIRSIERAERRNADAKHN